VAHQLLKLCSGVLLFSACSFINKFDDVKDGPVAKGGEASDGGKSSNGGSTSGDAGVPTEGGMAGNGAGGIDAPGGTGAVGANGGKGGTDEPGAGGMGGEPGLDGGMLLVGAAIGSPVEYSLIALSPELGEQLSQEESNRVLAIAYDSTSGESNIWFVFFANDTASSVELGTLSVRRYKAGGEYDELANLRGVPAPASPDIAVLRHRLFYRSTVPGAPPKNGFTLIDTSDLEEPKLVGMPQGPDLPNLMGILAHPSAAQDGGTVTLITQNNADCVPDTSPGAAATEQLCPVKARRGTIGETAQVATIPADGSAAVVGTIGFRSNIYGLGGWTTGVVGNGLRDIFIFPPDSSTAAKGSVSVRDINNFAESAGFDVVIDGRRIPAVALDPCRQIVLATELDSKNLYAITTADDGAGTVKAALGHVGGRVLFDQFTRTVFTAFQDTSNPAIDAWTLGGTETAPTLVARKRTGTNKWAPDVRINPQVIAIKEPLSAPCD
jgi:hypothetical protein